VKRRDAVRALRDGGVGGVAGLPALVEQHERSTDVPCSLGVQGTPRPLDAEAGMALYRAVQEALANARQHAVGAPVEVKLSWSDEQAELEVVTATGARHEHLDGSGLGAGLQGLAERAALVGGDFRAGPTEDGFRVELHVPTQRTATQEVR
jgi:signal transduction histidine kinase